MVWENDNQASLLQVGGKSIGGVIGSASWTNISSKRTEDKEICSSSHQETLYESGKWTTSGRGESRSRDMPFIVLTKDIPSFCHWQPVGLLFLDTSHWITVSKHAMARPAYSYNLVIYLLFSKGGIIDITVHGLFKCYN